MRAGSSYLPLIRCATSPVGRYPNSARLAPTMSRSVSSSTTHSWPTDVTKEGTLSMPAAAAGIVANKRPICFIGGWVGGKIRPLARYASILSDLGVETKCFYIEPRTLFFNKARISLPVRDMMDLLQSEENADRPWFFYSFSNGGCFVYDRFRQMLKSEEGGEEIEKRLAGAIFDSSPADPYVLAAAKAITAPNMTPLRLATASAAIASMFLLTGTWGFRKRFMQRMRDCDIVSPELYLYSTSDEITSVPPLEEIIQVRRKRVSVDGDSGEKFIWSKNFETSAHVAHLVSFPDEYKNVLEDFFVASLNGMDEKRRAKL
uniref:Transmembrane protein 53 n=1 Tax=Palpitomonas bilix TaxID=652834 RepID=A0A7S3D7D8_9EUKA|mmetsp:Transcript_24552/g.62168  ORF Transcript_24552/g.62168 Transcript_24552/m.62168 type:complete len:318 (+) Transcript_24552:45-998(+)